MNSDITEKDLFKVHQIIQNIFIDNELDEILQSQNFEEFEDWDSLSLMTMAYQLEEILKRKLSQNEIESINSYNSILLLFQD